ncbi:hypothetical protein KR074_011141 [Drosophila pseudoananassae]|nr:hypothetical protein KR074_011141 [Drosophila pseudoananassae]
MYDIKRLEAGQQQQLQSLQRLQQLQQQQQSLGLDLSGLQKQQLTCSVIAAPSLKLQDNPNSSEATHMTLLSLRRRRSLQRRACLLSILAAFVFGMALGVVVPMFGLPRSPDAAESPPDMLQEIIVEPLQNNYRVAFIKEEQDSELSAEQVFRNAFHLEQDKDAPDSMVVKKLDTNDGSIKEFHVQRTANGRYRKGPERRLTKKVPERRMQAETLRSPVTTTTQGPSGLIEDNVFWGPVVEKALPKGFASEEQLSWERFVGEQGRVVRLEAGCGRMQNRLVIFADGTRACARYRQNTDQIQGEIFSYYLGQLLNISNLAPSAATVVDTSTPNWAAALGDISQAQWKERRPVVLTRWLSDLEPAGIPQPFQPLERHLNKHDVWNLTRQLEGETEPERQTGLLKRLGAASSPSSDHQSRAIEETGAGKEGAAAAAGPGGAGAGGDAEAGGALVQRLIELAQWSDLIVFDYLIANLDRVVNNLYNFQWNADIMAAPAHNLARQPASQLLVFLDNESGLLHGYRLLKKYEAYHSLLLDNLCVFRRPTIEALQRLRAAGPGQKLRDLFEKTTSPGVRDVLPSLPDKSVKILVERIDRVLGQVHKCQGS